MKNVIPLDFPEAKLKPRFRTQVRKHSPARTRFNQPSKTRPQQSISLRDVMDSVLKDGVIPVKARPRRLDYNAEDIDELIALDRADQHLKLSQMISTQKHMEKELKRIADEDKGKSFDSGAVPAGVAGKPEEEASKA